MKLTNEHIDYIIKDLRFRGLIHEGLDEELVDHVCSSVEARMNDGTNFIEAYHFVLKSFGNTTGLRITQNLTIQSENPNRIYMLKNNLRIAWRNIRKHSLYSFINISGLAVGIAACLLIFIYLNDELSYENYNPNADRVFRVNTEIKFGSNHVNLASSSAPVANALQQDFPEIEATVRFRDLNPYLIKTSDEADNFKEHTVAWTDSTFFKIFSVNVLRGNPATALTDPESVAISKRIAEKYYSGQDPIGKTLILDNNYHAKVTAVYEDIPPQAHFHFDILIAMVGNWPVAKEALSTAFFEEDFNTYVMLKEGADAKALEAKLPSFIENRIGPQLGQVLGEEFSLEKFTAAGNIYEMTLMPIRDIHLYSERIGEFEPAGNIRYVYLFGAIAIFILAIACINFMNLSTAKSGSRAKEVGVRKVMGSLRPHLVRQFLTESIVVTFFSIVLAVAIAFLALPLFNGLAAKDLNIPFSHPGFYLILIAAALVIGAVAGIYPSFFLSAFKPVEVLKGNASGKTGGSFIRSGLVVFQFVISIILIAGAIAVNQQLSFIQNKKLGFKKEQVIIVKDAYALRPHPKKFKEEAVKINSIVSGTMTGYLPIDLSYAWRTVTPYWNKGDAPTTENMVNVQTWGIDNDYIKTLGMTIKDGRDFSEEFTNENSSIILNEQAARTLGLGEDAVGKTISTFGGKQNDGVPDTEKVKTYTVIGVVEDFNYASLKETIKPLAFVRGYSDGSFCFRFDAGRPTDVIESLQSLWKSMAPGQPFEYAFMDEDYGRVYLSEQRLAKVFSLFAGLAIIIACLGLFALTAFTAERRTKEIGIRKVLGASISSIVLLLSKDFGKLIAIAFVISTPVAWYVVNSWLEAYTYRTDISIVVYITAGLLSLVTAFATTAYQSIKAAAANPVDSLRSE